MWGHYYDKPDRTLKLYFGCNAEELGTCGQKCCNISEPGFNENLEEKNAEKSCRVGAQFMRFQRLWQFERKWPPKVVALMGGMGFLEGVCHYGGRL